jgi:hypothetical protein
LLVDELNIAHWRNTIEKKLSIIHDIRAVWQHKIDAVREDMLTVSIIVLIMIELLVAIVF